MCCSAFPLILPCLKTSRMCLCAATCTLECTCSLPPPSSTAVRKQLSCERAACLAAWGAMGLLKLRRRPRGAIRHPRKRARHAPGQPAGLLAHALLARAREAGGGRHPDPLLPAVHRHECHNVRPRSRPLTLLRACWPSAGHAPLHGSPRCPAGCSAPCRSRK